MASVNTEIKFMEAKEGHFPLEMDGNDVAITKSVNVGKPRLTPTKSTSIKAKDGDEDSISSDKNLSREKGDKHLKHDSDEYSSEEVTKKDAPSNANSYKDFSHIPPSENNVTSLFKAASAKEPTFPAKLHMILSNSQFEDIVSWMPHGRSWRILKPDVFEDRVLPLFFCHCRLSSFMRQVNGWGFKRIKHGPDYNSYYNELFLRGLPHLVERMRRESVSAKSKGGAVEDEPAPDLYKISEQNPLPENPPISEHLRRAAAENMPPMGMANLLGQNQRAMTGGMPGVMGGSMQAAGHGPMPSGMQSGYPGVTTMSGYSGIPGGMPGGMTGGTPGGFPGGLGRAMPGQADMLHAFRNGNPQRFGSMGPGGPGMMGINHYGRGAGPVHGGAFGGFGGMHSDLTAPQAGPEAYATGGPPSATQDGMYEMQRRMKMGGFPNPQGTSFDSSMGVQAPVPGLYPGAPGAPNNTFSQMDMYGRLGGAPSGAVVPDPNFYSR